MLKASDFLGGHSRRTTLHHNLPIRTFDSVLYQERLEETGRALLVLVYTIALLIPFQIRLVHKRCKKRSRVDSPLRPSEGRVDSQSQLILSLQSTLSTLVR